MSKHSLQLRRYAMFAGLSEAELQVLAHSLTLKRLDAHQIILHQNQIPAFVVIVVTGQLQATLINEEGRLVALHFINADETLGWESIVDEMPLAHSLTTTKKTDLILIPRQVAKSLLMHPWVSSEVLRVLTKSIRRLTDEQRILGLPNAFQRVYSQILNLTTQSGDTPRPTQLPKQQEIAVMVNTSRETVSRALQALVKQGVLIKSGQLIAVTNLERLRQLALAGSDKPLEVEAMK